LAIPYVPIAYFPIPYVPIAYFPIPYFPVPYFPIPYFPIPYVPTLHLPLEDAPVVLGVGPGAGDLVLDLEVGRQAEVGGTLPRHVRLVEPLEQLAGEDLAFDAYGGKVHGRREKGIVNREEGIANREKGIVNRE